MPTPWPCALRAANACLSRPIAAPVTASRVKSIIESEKCVFKNEFETERRVARPAVSCKSERETLQAHSSRSPSLSFHECHSQRVALQPPRLRRSKRVHKGDSHLASCISACEDSSLFSLLLFVFTFLLLLFVACLVHELESVRAPTSAHAFEMRLSHNL